MNLKENKKDMVKIGDKYKQKIPSWVKGKNRYFSWEYEVVGFKKESYGDFAECICTHDDGKKEPVGIDIELLLDDKSSYEKVTDANEIGEDREIEMPWDYGKHFD